MADPMISRTDEDPALTPFLALLTQDITAHPENLQVVPEGLVRRIDDLVGEMNVDLDEDA